VRMKAEINYAFQHCFSEKLLLLRKKVSYI